MNLTSFLRSLLIILIFGTLPSNSNAQVIQDIFDTPGFTNWTAPCGVTMVTVAVYGGGGGGGGSNTNSIGGGGGGAGGYAQSNFAVIPGNSYAIEVGAGGAGGNSASSGNVGARSRWDGGVLFAFGGVGGQSETLGGAGGVGGTASAWAINTTGATGGQGTVLSGGAGGACGGPNGGAGGVAGPPAVPGGAGSNYGAGGGGGGKREGGAYPPGGDGAVGAVIISYNAPFTQATAGIDVSTCNVVFLDGSTPDAGWTGTWSIVSGAPVIADVNDPNSLVTIPVPGTCAVVRWTFTSPGCASNFDDVQICYPLICNDDPCGAIDLPVGTAGCAPNSYSNNGATASTGMVEPGCGTYVGNDVWYSVVVPANGVVTINAADVAGGIAMEMGVAFYEGACNDVQHQGCDFYDVGNLPDQAELTYTGTPGSTVYIRVWDANGNEDSYSLCAFTHTNPSGDVLEGTTTIPCGSTSTFFDPGGDGGDYSNNSGSNYTICPDTPGQYVSIDFSTGSNFFLLEAGGSDYLTILDGGGLDAQLVGQWSGASNPGVITSSLPDGCLTIVFQSDLEITAAGWEATITCSALPGVNDTLCSATNCSGTCGQWVCQDGLYPTENNGNALEDIASNTAGCIDYNVGEIASHWFYFTALTTGTLEFTFGGPNGQDYNLAVWGPSTNGIPPCPMSTGDAPVLCSQADVQNTGNPVGLSGALGAGQSYEGPEGDGWISQLDVIAGETYAMMLNIFQNGNPQPVIDMTIGGSGTLDCTPISIILPVELSSLIGINQGDHNLISWITNSEKNNDYFTVERSVNGFDWEFVETVNGAGNSIHSKYYQLIDDNPYFPVTYYRLSQTDFDGKVTYYDVISVNGQKQTGDFVSALFPNPTDSYATFTYNGSNTSDALTVQVLNELGKVVMQSEHKVYSGLPATIRTDDLSSGMYHVVFIQGNERNVQKLSIIK